MNPKEIYDIAESLTKEYEKNTPMKDILALYKTLGDEWEKINRI